MPNPDDLKALVFASIAALIETAGVVLTDDTALIGDASVLDSMKLVELCLTLEDLATDLGFEFDWTSEAAMSRSRGMFRCAGALAAEFIGQSRSLQVMT